MSDHRRFLWKDGDVVLTRQPVHVGAVELATPADMDLLQAWTADAGGGNPYHDPHTGEFTTGPSGSREAGGLLQYLEVVASVQRKMAGSNTTPADFILRHGQVFPHDDASFRGKQGPQQMCYMNAGRLALEHPELTYVEGYISTFGVPIEHAWVVNQDGKVIDPTIRVKAGKTSHIMAYLGVPIKTEYLRETVLRTEHWGVFGYRNISRVLGDPPGDVVRKITIRARDFNPHHVSSGEKGGQFATGSGGGGPAPVARKPEGPSGTKWAKKKPAADVGLAAQLLAKNDDGATMEDVNARISPAEHAAMAKANEEMSQLTPTNVLHLQKDGTYTEERAAVHTAILREMFTKESVEKARPAPGADPTLVMMGGRPASGKTSLVLGHLGEKLKDALYLSADTIQEKLPGYRADHAGLFNGEGQDIALQAERMARELGLNIIYDATMKTNHSAIARVKEYIEAGYRVEGHFVHTTPAESAVRSAKRFSATGRYVPPAVSFNSRTNESTFDHLVPYFSRWSLYDNNRRPPVRIAEGQRS